MQKIGEKIALLVKSRGWQQKEFAEHIGYSAEHLSRLMKADPLPAKALRNIAKGLNLSIDELLHAEVWGKGRAPGLVTEADAPYGANWPGASDNEVFLRTEVERLHGELARLGDLLAAEQAISASLAEALKNLTGKGA